MELKKSTKKLKNKIMKNITLKKKMQINAVKIVNLRKT